MQSIHLRRGLLEQASPVVMVVTSPVDPLCCPIVFCPWTIAADHVHSSTPADLDSSPLSDRRHITEQGEGPYSNRGSARRLLGLSVEAFGTRCCSAPHWADFSENKRGGGRLFVCVSGPCRCPYRTNDASQGCGVRCTVPMRRVNDSRLSSRRTGLPPAARQPVCRASRRAK